jgi:putative redox protein
MEAKLFWTDAEQFVGQASSGHAVVVDSSKAKTANGPMEMVLIGLCACTATDVVTILRKKREPFVSIEVHARAERAAEPPTVFTRIDLIYRVKGKVAPKAVEDAVRLSEEKYCSVAAMLRKTADLRYQIEYVA